MLLQKQGWVSSYIDTLEIFMINIKILTLLLADASKILSAISFSATPVTNFKSMAITKCFCVEQKNVQIQITKKNTSNIYEYTVVLGI